MIRIHFKVVLRKPTLLEDFHFRAKSRTSTTRVFTSVRCTHELLDSAKLDNSVPGMITVNEENCTDALKPEVRKRRDFEREVEMVLAAR